MTSVDGSVISSSQKEYIIPLRLDTEGQHTFTPEPAVAASIDRYDVILGLPWWVKYNPPADWATRQLNLPAPLVTPSPTPSVEFVAGSLFLDTPKEEVQALGVLCFATAETTKTSLPKEYSQFKDLFSKSKGNTLPPHRDIDHAIETTSDFKPFFGPIYSLSEVELKALKDYIDENLANEFIRPSKSPSGAPILFAKKKDGSLRLCVDYRALNKVTVKNRYPLPLMSELFDRIKSAKIFTKIDLRGAYNLIRIRKGDEWKTAFRTRYGHFEYQVLPFGLTNAPATFQAYINNALREFLDKFCLAYLDDILIYSESKEEHVKHVTQILQTLREHGLYAKLEKCNFHVYSVDFLGFIISTQGTHMEKARVDSIKDWPTPKSVKDVQTFLGFANFYRRFIYNYAAIANGLTSLTRTKDNPKFTWTPAAEESFNNLKNAFTTAPFLRHFDPKLPITLTTDASDFATAAILSQPHNGKLHPVAFHSHKLQPPEENYGTPDKEMLAIVEAFRKWRHYLEGAAHTITVFTDHKNLETFMGNKVLNRRQTRWLQLIAEYDFHIAHIPGKNNPADAPSRRPDYQIAVIHISKDELPAIKAALPNDELAQEVLTKIRSTPDLSDSDWSEQDGLLLFKTRIYVPDITEIRLRLVRAHHDSPLAGHFGVARTVELLSRKYYWPSMTKFVEDYVTTCDTCSRSKAPRHKPHGQLMPLEVPSKPWSSLSMDFVVELPPSGESKFDAICVIVDRFTKMAHYFPCHTTIKTPELANLFISGIVRLHGLPESIVSDRDTRFTSDFWSTLCSRLSVKRKLSTAYHPQTDGQTERLNQTMEQYLRSYINYQQDDWTDFLPLAEFAYNNSKHATSGISPFFALYGYNPEFGAATHDPKTGESINAAERLTQLKKIHEQLKIDLGSAQVNQAKYHNAKHKAVTFSVGDKVWLKTTNFKTQRPSKKLDAKRVGPFKVERKINDQAYRLSLPASMKIWPTFHVSLLDPYKANTIPGRTQSPPPPVSIDDPTIYEVEEILDSRRRRRRLQYKVRWTGYGPEDDQWVPASEVNSGELTEAFHAKYPGKPS